MVLNPIIGARWERGPGSGALVLAVPVRFPPLVVTQSAVALPAVVPAAVVPGPGFLRPSFLGPGSLRLDFHPQERESLPDVVFAVLARLAALSQESQPKSQQELAA